MRGRGSRVALVIALTLAAAAPVAHANGDPASDVLLQAKIYFPNERVSEEQARKLHAIVDKASARGYAIRVALIEDESDLGTVPNLLNQALRPPQVALEGLQAAAGGSSDGLALTAEQAVAALASAAGHPLAAVQKGGGGGGVVAGIVIAVVLVGLGISGAFWARRSAPRSQPEPDPQAPAGP